MPLIKFLNEQGTDNKWPLLSHSARTARKNPQTERSARNQQPTEQDPLKNNKDSRDPHNNSYNLGCTFYVPALGHTRIPDISYTFIQHPSTQITLTETYRIYNLLTEIKINQYLPKSLNMCSDRCHEANPRLSKALTVRMPDPVWRFGKGFSAEGMFKLGPDGWMGVKCEEWEGSTPDRENNLCKGFGEGRRNRAIEKLKEGLHGWSTESEGSARDEAGEASSGQGTDHLVFTWRAVGSHWKAGVKWGVGCFCFILFSSFDCSWENKRKTTKTGCRETSRRLMKYSGQEVMVLSYDNGSQKWFLRGKLDKI